MPLIEPSGIKCSLFKDAHLSLEVLMLLVGGMIMLISGCIVFPVPHWTLPRYENGLYGLLLLIFALQIITLGKTPFGDMRRSKRVLAVGVLVGAAGIATCCLPTLDWLPRMLLWLCFGPGGIFLLWQMCIAKDKLRVWLKHGGVFWHLIFGCSGVYLLSVLIAVLIWQRLPLTSPQMAITLLFFAVALFYLAWALQRIYRKYPEAEQRAGADGGLSTSQAMLLLTGVFMVLLGVLLVPVSLGRLSFSGSAQLGLLMVIFAVQMLASGSTPLGTFRRSWLVVVAGFLFAALGIISCLIPEILLAPLTILVGVLNIISGGLALVKQGVQICGLSAAQRAPIPPILVRLFVVQLIMNLLAIMFGTSMLVPGLVPGVAIGVILAANGGVLLYLLHILVVLDKLQGAERGA